MTPDQMANSRNETALKLKGLINAVFNTNGPVAGLRIFTEPSRTLEEAAQIWLACQVEDYLALLVKRSVIAIRVLKNVQADGMHEVHLVIKAEGRQKPEFPLKVTLTINDATCQFNVQDFLENSKGFVDGIVNRAGGFKLSTNQRAPRVWPDEPEYSNQEEQG